MLSPFFFLPMIHLTPNVEGNSVAVNPYQARKFLPTFTTYLMALVEEATGNTTVFIPDVTEDNERYTRISLPTNAEDLVNGSIRLTRSGLYTYKIFGQNSATNLDPEDASVVGICEVGACKVSDEVPWSIPTISIPNNVIYYE